ncbi:hypothetical protein AVEN_264590-1 [Araneus ventricosus]|uniref:Uncharacterized protein n=1 Tax=Araneus ventricosus TaxID=182803 RepID=A0A4Y2RXG8_ARAVE|nr:hypothetical protein AVEN_264590-1 [Araneus ventricosus]
MSILVGYDNTSKGYRRVKGERQGNFRSKKKKTKQIVELELEREENQTVEEAESNEIPEVNPCEDEAEDEESNSQIQPRRSERKQNECLPKDSHFMQI